MKIVNFVPEVSTGSLDPSVPVPALAKDVLPQWYKDAETFFEKDGESLAGLKTCVPFLDGLLAGFVVLTYTNIYVSIGEDGSVDIDWDADTTSEPVMERPKETGHTMPRPAGHFPNHLVWTPKWGFKTPKGFSGLVTHPLNRFDLPFTTMSAIIDSDNYFGSGNIPFFIKEGFEGVIPKGTPMFQIIPIKREDWKALYDPTLVPASEKITSKVRTVIRGYYRDYFWVKKNYSIERKKNNE